MVLKSGAGGLSMVLGVVRTYLSKIISVQDKYFTTFRALIGRGGVYLYFHVLPDGFLCKLVNLNLK